MKKQIVKVNPFYEPRMWGGGSRLREEFHYVTDVAPLGEVYNVVALKDHADCYIPEMNMTLSELYTACPDWFSCDTEELPIRVNILDPVEKLSIQIHPDDTFAKMYNGGRGKPEAWVILDTVEDGEIQFGHNAKNKEEFIRLQTTEKGRFLHERFAFYTCVDGEGKINGVPVRKGETILVPEGMGWITIEGNLDLFLASYRNEKQ